MVRRCLADLFSAERRGVIADAGIWSMRLRPAMK